MARKQYKGKKYTKKYTKRRYRRAATTSDTRLVNLTAIINVQAQQLRVAPIIFNCHLPGYWSELAPNPVQNVIPNVLDYQNLYHITNALSLY